MSFYLITNGRASQKLKDKVEEFAGQQNVPRSAVDFIKDSIDAFPHNTILHIVASGHKAVPLSSHQTPESHLMPASLEIKVQPIHFYEDEYAATSDSST